MTSNGATAAEALSRNSPEARAATKGKAQALASAAGLALAAPLKVREGGSPARASGAPPIEARTQKIQASVTVTYSTR